MKLGIINSLLILLISTPVSAADKNANALEDLKFKQGQEQQNDVRALQAEVLVSKNEELAIKQAQKLIRKYKGQLIEADLQLRLAELYMRRAKSERFFELQRTNDLAAKIAIKQIKKASSKKMVNKAISIYEQIQRRFPNYDKMDVVVFNNAFARQSIGKYQTSKELYWKIINKHNYSYLVPDSHLAIGEMAFNQRKFKSALKHFTAIKQYPNSQVYPYGLYKSAWAQYNLQNTKKALAELEEVVRYGRVVEKEKLDARLDLRKEALRDMVLFFSEVYPSKKAYSYFSEWAQEDELSETILQLSNLYKRHSKFNDRFTVLNDYIDNNKTDPLIPTIYDEIVWNFESQKNRQRAVAALSEFHEVCNPKSKWTKKNTENKDCYQKLYKSSIKLARKWLNIWNKNNQYTEFADSAEKAFESFMLNNPDKTKVSEARYAYAELLFKRSKFKKASSSYELVAQDATNKKIAHDSLYAAIVSLEKSVQKDWSSDDEKSYKRLVGKYEKDNPKGKYLLDVKFKHALIVYEKGRLDEAAPIFMVLGEDYKSTNKGIQSQDFYLDILNQRKDYAKLKAYAKKVMAGNKSKERVIKLSKMYEEAYFLEVQNLEKDGKNKLAIAEYLKFSKENSRSKLAPMAHWNAVQLLFKEGETYKAAKQSFRFYKLYPKHKQSQASLLKSAESFEKLGELLKAAEVLEILAKVDKANRLKWMSLAGDFYLLEKRNTKAKAIFQTIKGSNSNNLAFHALMQLYKLEIPGSANYWKLNQEVINSNRQPEASLAQLELVEKIYDSKDYSKAFIAAKKVLNMDSNASMYAKSKARFIQAEILADEFRRQSVHSKLERFTMVFAIKTEKLEKAQRAYQSAIRYGDPYVAVESMRRLSKLYSNYVETLKTMPVPSGLPEAEAPAFRNEMQKLAMPMEEKGVDTLAEALLQARKLGLHNGIVAKLQAELDQLNMKSSGFATMDIQVPDVIVPKINKVEVGS